MARSWETTRVRHGTHSGWCLHKELGDDPCDACYKAKSEYDKRRRSAPEQARRARLAAKAQAKAHTELKHRHEKEYRQLYEYYRDIIIFEDEMEFGIEED